MPRWLSTDPWNHPTLLVGRRWRFGVRQLAAALFSLLGAALLR